jgi:catechol-2,3-dioxygenase
MLQTNAAADRVRIEDIAHVVLEVTDLGAAEAFYTSLLGLKPAGRNLWPVPGSCETSALRVPSGQHLVLAQGAPRNDPRAWAAHHAYAVPADTRKRLIKSLEGKGIAVHRFREDRPEEADQNFYFDDPSGNRIQLVVRPKASGAEMAIDHVGLVTHNILWAQEFYGAYLGLPVRHHVGWKTQDYVNAKALGDKGMAAAMPGARYWNERYSQFEKERKTLRPCAQLYFAVGGEASLAVYLSPKHYQAPPDNVSRGLPVLGFRTGAELGQVADALSARGYAVEGPVQHGGSALIAASLYVKDPGGNFLEFCAAE